MATVASYVAPGTAMGLGNNTPTAHSPSLTAWVRRRSGHLCGADRGLPSALGQSLPRAWAASLLCGRRHLSRIGRLLDCGVRGELGCGGRGGLRGDDVEVDRFVATLAPASQHPHRTVGGDVHATVHLYIVSW